jgi:phosphatidate cytidylyltransferase
MTATSWTIGVLFAAAALGLVAAVAVARRPGDRTILARAVSYAVLAMLLATAVAVGPLGVAVLVTVMVLVGLVEWSNLGRLPVHHRVGLLGAAVVLIVALYFQGVGAADWLIGGLVLVGMLWPVVRADTGRAIHDLGFAAIGFLSIAVLLAHGVVLARDLPTAGVLIFAALGLGCAGSDVGAYLVGKRFGHARLAPTLSPNKTLAGVVGNFLGAAIGLALLVPLVAVGSVWGDLFESAVKREVGVKDAGAWLPGFGGLLDRIDSLLLAIPLAYWTLRICLAVA